MPSLISQSEIPEGDFTYPQFSAVARNYDNRGGHIKFFGKGPASIVLGKDYAISEAFMTESIFGVLRGMHFQTPGQPKLIQAITGQAHGFALCAAPGHEDFGNYIEFELNEASPKLLVPGDWALGYEITDEEVPTRILYLAGADFVAGGDTGIDPFDDELALPWFTTRDEAILSDRDKELGSWADYVASIGN